MITERTLCVVFALYSGWSGIWDPSARAQAQEMAATNTVKFKMVVPWKNNSFRLVVSGTSNAPSRECQVLQVPGKSACYQPAELPDSPSAKVGQPWTIAMVAMVNPLNKKVCITAEREAYFADKSKLICAKLPVGGLTFPLPSYAEFPESPGGIEAAIAQFERQFDVRALAQWSMSYATVNMVRAAPRHFFNGPNSGVAPSVSPRMEGMDLVDGIVRFEIKGMNLTQDGVFWVDINAGRVVKSVVNGQEMDLSSGEPLRSR